MIFSRDYLIPAPNRNWTGVVSKLIEPPEIANYVRIPLQKSGSPKLEDGLWQVDKYMYLVPACLGQDIQHDTLL